MKMKSGSVGDTRSMRRHRIRIRRTAENENLFFPFRHARDHVRITLPQILPPTTQAKENGRLTLNIPSRKTKLIPALQHPALVGQAMIRGWVSRVEA